MLHFTQDVEKAVQSATTKTTVAPGAPTKKKRKRRCDESTDDDGDEDGIEVNPPDEDVIEGASEQPVLNSMVEVDVPGRGVFYCSIGSYEEDGAVVMLTQDGEEMNIFLEDFVWKTVYKCDECQEYGYKRMSCDACGVMRPQGVLDDCNED